MNQPDGPGHSADRATNAGATGKPTHQVALLPRAALRAYLVMLAVLIIELALISPRRPPPAAPPVIIANTLDRTVLLRGEEHAADCSYGIAFPSVGLLSLVELLPKLRVARRRVAVRGEQEERMALLLDGLRKLAGELESIASEHERLEADLNRIRTELDHQLEVLGLSGFAPPRAGPASRNGRTDDRRRTATRSQTTGADR